MVDEDHFERVVNAAFHLIEAGETLESLVDFMRSRGLDRSTCIRALRTVASVEADEAERLVDLTPWPEEDEGGRYWYMDAVNLLEDTFELAARTARQSGDPAGELGTLRFNLAFALNLVREERTADGHTVIVFPSDSMIVEEVERLRATVSGGDRGTDELPEDGQGRS